MTRRRTMQRIITVVFLAVVVTSSANETPLTNNEKDSIRTMHERFCGSDRMCSKSNQTTKGDCRVCPGCKCDPLCEKYGDCCADKAIDLLGKPTFHPSRYHCHSNAYKLIYDRKAEFSFHSIQKCSIRDDKELLRLCENPDPSNITLGIPAQTETDLYRNQFCAECNGESDVTTWAIKAECTQLVWLTTGMTSRQIIQSFVDNPGCAIYLRPPENSNHRICFTPEEEMVSTCNGTEDTNSSWRKLCRSYSAPIHLFGSVYRNVFCYMCNQGSLDDSFVSPPSCAFDTAYPFSVILDPEALLMEQKPSSFSCECDPGYIFDWHTDACKQIECTADRVLRDETCFSVIRSANGLVYLLEVKLTPSSKLLVQDNLETWVANTAGKLKAHMKQQIGGGFVGVGLFRVGVQTYTDENGPSKINSISIHSKFVIKWESEIDVMESTLLKLRKSDWTVTIDSSNVTFNAEPHWTDPDDVIAYPEITTEKVDKTQSIFRLDHGFTFDLTKEHDALYVAETLKCPRVKIMEDIDYTYNEEVQEWRYVGTNDSLDLSMFEPSANKTGYVCFMIFKENVTNCGEIGYLSPGKLDTSILKYVSIFFQGVGIFCLFLTFFVFCLFSDLRTVPGKNIMGLVLTLFLAMVLYIAGSDKLENSSLCKGIGMSIHSILLSSFTWLCICTVHLFIVLRSIIANGMSDTSGWRRFLLYVVLSVIVPAVIVSITVAVNHSLSEGAGIGYGNGICYLSNFYSVVLALGAPVAIVLIINVVIFAATMKAMKSFPKQSKDLKSRKSDINTHVRVSLLTGVTWFFALVSVLVEGQAFKYLFVIFCGLQGVYIFVVFVCTHTVLYLIRNCCSGMTSTGRRGQEEVKVKMTFNGKDLEFEELGLEKDPDYACIDYMRKAQLAMQGVGDDTSSSCNQNDCEADADSLNAISRMSTMDRQTRTSVDEGNRLHEVDMHNAELTGSDYGLLMDATTKQIRDPCNVMFNPVFQ